MPSPHPSPACASTLQVLSWKAQKTQQASVGLPLPTLLFNNLPFFYWVRAETPVLLAPCSTLWPELRGQNGEAVVGLLPRV